VLLRRLAFIQGENCDHRTALATRLQGFGESLLVALTDRRIGLHRRRWHAAVAACQRQRPQ
jgi:hypothetical protein